MSNRLVRGFAWYTYPDLFGLDAPDNADHGHPFAFRPGEVKTPAEVVFCRPATSSDAGIQNEARANAFLVMTKTQLHPMVCQGWESDPAVLTEKFKTDDGKVKMLRIVQLHHRHRGDLLECELKVEEG
jgi:hypothetical protein